MSRPKNKRGKNIKKLERVAVAIGTRAVAPNRYSGTAIDLHVFRPKILNERGLLKPTALKFEKIPSQEKITGRLLATLPGASFIYLSKC